MTNEEGTKSKIMQAIADCSDNNMRAVLLLMLGTLEEIGEKIDLAMKDEKSLRDLVLNGYSEIHNDDHDWLFRMRPVIGRWSDTIAWADTFRGIRKDGMCNYVREQLVQQKANSSSKRHIGEELIIHALVSITSVVITLLSVGAYFALH